MSDPVETLAAHVTAELGDEPSRWYVPTGYDSVALAVLDSIYSTGNHYTGVINALDLYRAARRADGADPTHDTATDLLTATQHWGGPKGLAEHTNRWRTSTATGAPFKAVAALGAARILAAHHLETVAQVRHQLTKPEDQESSPVKTEWLRLPGQRHGLTWTYFLMLCGVPGVKADRMVVRFVSDALCHDIDSAEAATLVGQVADQLQVPRNVLDHAIWRKESGRPYLLEDEGHASSGAVD